MADRILPNNDCPSLWLLSKMKAFNLPRQSSCVDPSLLWYWIELTYQMGTQHGRFQNEYKLVFRNRYIRCWYDEEHEKNDQYTTTLLEVTFKQTGIKKLYRCQKGPHVRKLNWRELRHRPTTESDLSVAQFNLRQLLRGHIKQEHTEEAIAEIELLLSKTDKRRRPARQLKQRFKQWAS